jgi:NAD(P)-dependent dehydrogenase (short-subunit alcohol dehydrogenase family)/acyl carrier protein
LDLDLEADLGIDTVKQAELFSAVRENYNIPRREDLMLVEYNTLEKVIGFVRDSLGGQQPQSEVVTQSARETGMFELPKERPSQQPTQEEIKGFLLTLVSEKTGYPVEILELDLDLEADLGIDTVKQAELFSAVRENYNIPRREDLMLVEYNTLEKVIGFVQNSLDELNQTFHSADTVAAVDETSQLPEEPIKEEADEVVTQSIMRRGPVPLLRPRHDLCKPTGVVFNNESRVLVIGGETGVADELIDLLLEYKVEVFKLNTNELDQLDHTISTWLEDGAINGLFFLPSLNREPSLKNMVTEDWQTLLDQNVYTLFRIMQALPEDVFVVCATNTGGLHGIGQSEIFATGGGVSGFCKALAFERPDSLIKIVDFHPKEEDVYIATQLFAEARHDPAAIEVGYDQGQRFGISIEERLMAEQADQLPQNSVFLFTGGTGGITRPIVQDLAKNTTGKFYLTGRTNLPSPEDPLMKILETFGPEGVQKAIIEKLSSQSQKLTPVEIRNKVDRFVRAAGTVKFIEELNHAGVKASYIVADVTNPHDVERAVTTILQEEGRIDVVVHAAGYERSRKLSKKSLDEFQRTMNVKASGYFFLYQALRDHNALPQHFVLFSSVAGRFGNTGQTDYSAANDLATKIGVHLNATHPNTRVTTIDWGPWDEVGMASRGAIPRLMSMAGIEMMDPQIAAKLVYAELSQGGGQEVIYAGSLGMLESQINEKSGLDLEKSNRALRAGNPPTLILSEVTGFDSKNGAIFEVTLDPNDEPFLHDHALNGTPLFPGVMGIEGFSAAAQHVAAVLGSGNPPGLQLTELENIRFENAFKFYRNEPRHIVWRALPLKRETGIEVYVTLESHNPSRLEEVPQLVQHFSGTVHLKANRQDIDQLVTAPPSWNGKTTLGRDEIYTLYFHGPAFQVIEGVQRDKEGLLGKLNSGLPPITSQPVSLDTNPVLIELCLQTSGIWEIGKTGAMSLPKSIGHVRLYRRETNGDPIFAQVQPLPSDNGVRFNSRVLDSKGRIYLELEDYRTSALPANFDGAALTPIRNLVNGNGDNPA